MSEITQPPPDVPTQDSNSRVNRLNAASDQSTSNNQSAEQQSGKQAAEAEPEKQVSHHDPAVTLASTLSKLDAGSHFQATVNGQDSDGRTIIQSELGTYLVEVEKNYVEEFKKIQKEEQLEIRVVTIDKEIKAEIYRPVETEEGKTQLTTIPVSLTLTDLAHAQAPVPNAPPPTASQQQPLEDIRSQYNATTLYRAERIAREIGEKLDNLPLPTSAPNYTVFGSAPPPTEQAAEKNPKQVSSNVFIQEVSTSANQAANAGQIAQQTVAINNLLGRDISVEVIKTVPQTTIPLPDSLPAAVRNEITAATPLDNVVKGQQLNINVAAVAVPEAKETPVAPTAATVGSSPQTVAGAPATPIPPANNPAASTVVTAAPPAENAPATNQPAQSTTPQSVVSGIIVDAQQSNAARSKTTAPSANPIAAASYGQPSSPAANTAKPSGQTNANNTYYLATPTSVLKFTSSTPLVAGTIVSFIVTPTVAPESQARPIAATDTPQNPAVSSAAAVAASTTAAGTETTPTQSSTASTPLNAIAPTLADKIDQFFPQELDQLTEEWGSISLAMSALATTASSSMAAIMASRIPNMQSPEQLSATMFFFLSALKSATPARTWMGPDVSARLRQIGAGRTIDRIDHDFSRLARFGAEVPAGEWRPLLIPAQSGQDYMAIPMIIKHIGGDEKEGSENQGHADPDEEKHSTRFILEINFSELGKVVIDGLLKKTRLDIILKSNEVIPHAVKSKLSRKFTDAIETANFDGELVIIDTAPSEISVRKMIEQMTHNAKIEKKI